MHRLLTALSITDSMGYCQGMNYVADFLLKVFHIVVILEIEVHVLISL
jgi:hypothetical protein